MQKLTPDDWKQVFELLDTALELPPQQREHWLATLDASRASLKPALLELLARHGAKETDDFLKALPQFTRVEAGVEPIIEELRPDATIGAYRLIRELGRGGMSAVWLAERVDGKFKRQVALKFPYAGPAQKQLAERLLLERDILAGLEHPNIARLYDADVTASGQPFLVLEYVDGIPIQQYCESKQLSLRERLVLFLQVFNAVQYAHAHLVIHRDIKPSNILITADGTVHLLDFGIARLITQGTVEASPLTELGGRALTPDYASPEQIAGRPLSTASDIYSLGVVFYELLARTRPYRLKRDSRASLEDAIAEADVIPPSRAVSDAGGDARLIRNLRGDLDTLVLKALAKNPGERYSTAQDMAEDVRRFLDGEPIKARPPTLSYRAKKFVARHRWAVAASGMVAASLIAALVVTVNATLEARRGRDLAASRLSDVRHLANVFLFEVDSKINNIPGTTEARQLLVTTGLSYLDRMATDAGDDVSLLREIANGYDRLGEIQGSPRISNLGQTEAAMVSYQKAYALRQHPGIAQSADPEVLRECAFGEQRMATLLYNVAKFNEASEHTATAVALLTRAISASPPETRADVQRERAEAQANQGFAIAATGDMQGGLKTLRESVAFYEGLPPAQLDDAKFGNGYAIALNRMIRTLGELPGNQGLSEALELAPRLVNMDRKLLAAAPERANLQRGLVRDISVLGALLAQAGRHEEALVPFAEAHRLYAAQVAADPRDKSRREYLNYLRVNETKSLLALGRVADARADIEPAVEDLSLMLEEDPANGGVQITFVGAAVSFQQVIAAQARLSPGSQHAQLRRAVSLLERADVLIQPLAPKLTGSEAELAGQIVAGRRECEQLLAHGNLPTRTSL